MINLKDYVCIYPFKNIEIHETNVHFCCPEWLPYSISPAESPVKEMWNSQMAIDIRKNVMDGTYKFCDKTMCPHLNSLLSFGKDTKNVIVHKDKLEPSIKQYYDLCTGEITENPQIMQMSFDRTCNLKCPACRLDFIVQNTKGIEKITKRIDEITEEFGQTINMIYTSSSGEPFASVATRNFFKNFDKTKYPKLQSIHIHTNATLWDKDMWESMSKIHPFVQSIEISIDAATKETYENKVRIGGDWDKLINNLNYIASLPNIKNVKTSFVVQKDNYKEMNMFLNLMKTIFGKKVMVYYSRMQDWGTYQLGNEFDSVDVSNPNNTEHHNFIEELKLVYKDPQFFGNILHLIPEDKTII
jgi:hypothetical protein